jgi:hypothetical protein
MILYDITQAEIITKHKRFNDSETHILLMSLFVVHCFFSYCAYELCVMVFRIFERQR